MKIGTMELVVIVLVALVVVGPTKLPQLARTLGETLGSFKKQISYYENELDEVKDVISDIGDIDEDDNKKTKKKSSTKKVEPKPEEEEEDEDQDEAESEAADEDTETAPTEDSEAAAEVTETAPEEGKEEKEA
ncbi:MAG: twin-arginine translocase TatA/TatE family subunit [Clostridiales bacterium]|nr:twin-arginine translocase TatA/TatE family subunit [Clostridiales bacterium]